MKSLNRYLMGHLLPFNEFVDRLNQRDAEKATKDRRQLLAGIQKTQYAIMLTFDNIDGIESLLEHEQFKKFAKTSNRYTYHPENANIPVKAHYHIYPSNSKRELYALNVDDGSAHHKINRGHVVPRKEADELRSLGVKLPSNNILEGMEYQLNESITGDYLTVCIIIDED